MTIWVDADALPRAVKEILVKASIRRQIDVVLVANRWLEKPKARQVTTVLVTAGADVADDHIAEHCQPGDLVITADIPLAARAVEAGAEVVTPYGRVLDEQNVREALSIRDFQDDLRSTGVMTGGPAPFGNAERQAFANALDRWLAQQP
ncbi:MAG: YaiI/YqxD family protein [Bradymonadaceae bacterium]|nr:YaiI/YqxD family protein [Lujinxingiaceae bacterium]